MFKRRRFPVETILLCVRGYFKYGITHHGGIKRLTRPTRGFQTMRTAYATIKGFEIIRMIRHRHCLLCEPGVAGEIRFVNTLFHVAA